MRRRRILGGLVLGGGVALAGLTAPSLVRPRRAGDVGVATDPLDPAGPVPLGRVRSDLDALRRLRRARDVPGVRRLTTARRIRWLEPNARMRFLDGDDGILRVRVDSGPFWGEDAWIDRDHMRRAAAR